MGEGSIESAHLGRNQAKQFPASSRFPFLAAELNDVGLLDKSWLAKIAPHTIYGPEWAAFGQSASRFSIRNFLPEFASTLCAPVKEKPPQVFIVHDSQFQTKTARVRPSGVHS
jgi:hypothetical protein